MPRNDMKYNTMTSKWVIMLWKLNCKLILLQYLRIYFKTFFKWPDYLKHWLKDLETCCCYNFDVRLTCPKLIFLTEGCDSIGSFEHCSSSYFNYQSPLSIISNLNFVKFVTLPLVLICWISKVAHPHYLVSKMSSW